jgi:hypothetical protein
MLQSQNVTGSIPDEVTDEIDVQVVAQPIR